MYIFSRTFDKRKQRENMYIVKICTFIVHIIIYTAPYGPVIKLQ